MSAWSFITYPAVRVFIYIPIFNAFLELSCGSDSDAWYELEPKRWSSLCEARRGLSNWTRPTVDSGDATMCPFHSRAPYSRVLDGDRLLVSSPTVGRVEPFVLPRNHEAILYRGLVHDLCKHLGVVTCDEGSYALDLSLSDFSLPRRRWTDTLLSSAASRTHSLYAHIDISLFLSCTCPRTTLSNTQAGAFFIGNISHPVSDWDDLDFCFVATCLVRASASCKEPLVLVALLGSDPMSGKDVSVSLWGHGNLQEFDM